MQYKQYEQMRGNDSFGEVIRKERINPWKGQRGMAKTTAIIMLLVLMLVLMFIV